MGAPSARVSELSRHWAGCGHHVSVMTGFPNHPTGVVYPDYRSKIRQLVYRESVDGVRVIRTWLWPLPNRKPHERILNYTSFSLSSSITGSFIARPDIIIATSPQLLVGMTGWWLSRTRGIPFVLEIRDLWPDAILASGVGNNNSMFSKTLSAISGFLYQNCDHLVVVTPAFKAEIVKGYGINPEKISIVENGVEIDLFSDKDSKIVLNEQPDLENRFVVSYIGTLGLAHGLSTMLKAASRLQVQYPDMVFLLVGEGADKERLVKLVKDKGLSNVRFLPQQPREKVPVLIKASDVCVVMLKKAPVFKTVIPTKMLEFMACGRPVILGVDGQARQVLEEAEGGIYTEPNDPDALTDAIVKLYKDTRLRNTLGQSGRRYIVKNLSRKKTSEKYLKVLRRVLSTRNGAIP